jgi:putative ABC transport system permease protein
VIKARLRSMWRALTRSRDLDAEMQAEMRFHLEMEAERLMRDKGLAPEEARRQAYIRFGGVEKYKEETRDTRSLQWLGAMSLDARLALRMLVKQRWLTLVGGFATAVAVAVSTTFFGFTSELLNPALPLDGGERVVAVKFSSDGPHQFHSWRDDVQSIELLSAFRTAQHNLVSDGVPPEPVRVAEMTASGFALARTAPFRGRYLLPGDELQGAEPVLVIGYDAWQTRFHGDPDIVGRAVNLGGVRHTVAGVMPDGFRFPHSHQFWVPLRPDASENLNFFGRLAPGATIDRAQAEVTTVVRRTTPSADRARGVVVPYTHAHVDLTDPRLVWLLRLAQLVIAALSLVVAVNLAILVYARTVTRLGEIALRTALGASRMRILTQLFLEAFALTAAGAAGGLVLSHFALQRFQWIAVTNGSVPFWLRFELSFGTVLYALALAIFGAVIMGVFPGLKATGRSVSVNLGELNARSGTRLGGTWTALVVAQVAITVAILPVAAYLAWPVVRIETTGPGFAAEQFVVGTVFLGEDRPVERRAPSPASVPRFEGPARPEADQLAARQTELLSRLEREPGVAAVTFSSGVPGFSRDRSVQLPDGAHEVNVLEGGLNMLDAYDAEVLAGRTFDTGDPGAASTVIVNRTFVQQLLGGREPLGVRFTYADAPNKSHQIVGVVRDFPSFSPVPGSDATPTVYHAAAPGSIDPFTVSVRFRGGIPARIAERMRAIGAEVDPALQLRRVVPLTQFYDDVRWLWRYLAWGAGLVTLSVLLLSAAGIYALMSFTVAQRTREIGIRTALGAHPRKLLLTIFGRAMRQLALGLFAGSVLAGLLFVAAGFTLARASALLAGVGTVMLVVGILAALGPARRSLRIDTVEALSAEG